MIPTFNISIAFVQGMLSGIQPRGEAVDRFLKGAGIAPELLREANARVTAEQYVALLKLLIDERNDEALGFLVRPLRRGSFALIAREGLGALTLDVAIRRMARAFMLLQEDLVFKLVRRDDAAGIELRLNDVTKPYPEFLDVLIMRVSWRLLAWLVDARLPPIGFDFACARPAHAEGYPKIFSGRIRFDCEHTAVWFDSSQLARKIRRDEAALRTFLSVSHANVIVPRREQGVTHAVRSHLLQMLPQWADLSSVSAALCMSASTLQRRLSTESASFQSIKDELRRDIAIARLNTSTTPLAVLADELGFTDSATFQRAFKRWTGSAPGVYRNSAG